MHRSNNLRNEINMDTKVKKNKNHKHKLIEPISTNTMISSNTEIPNEPIYTRNQVREKFKNTPLSKKARRIIESLYGIEDKNYINESNKVDKVFIKKMINE